mmetsp:Transcript_18513/g.62025  ORF Transcript_18513/g.62025 Transcript_18513/m.62025 type:complete len:126 (-) Transcript_18513:1433-1810(-)
MIEGDRPSRSPLEAFIHAKCISPYVADRVSHVLGDVAITTLAELAACSPGILENRIRALKAEDELWLLTHVRKVHAAALIEASRKHIRPPVRWRRGLSAESLASRASGGTCVDAVEDEVKRMRLQ